MQDLHINRFEEAGNQIDFEIEDSGNRECSQERKYLENRVHSFMDNISAEETEFMQIQSIVANLHEVESLDDAKLVINKMYEHIQSRERAHTEEVVRMKIRMSKDLQNLSPNSYGVSPVRL